MTTRRPLLVVSIPILTLATAALLIAEDSTGIAEYALGAYASLLALAIVGGIVVWRSVRDDELVDDDMSLSTDDLERAMTDNVPTAITAKELIEQHAPPLVSTPTEVVIERPEPLPEPVVEPTPAAPIVLSPAAEVFVNLGRRNKQLNRQMLTLIAHLERDELDPDTLQGLYELDHLATRMRRNEETLLMLASTRRVRQWSPPVSLEDVLRSALAEVERFARVELDHVPEVEIVGAAVPDLTHMLAELIDNATAFSHASTLVTISAHTTLEGLEIEVLDSGHGIAEEKRDALNALLADPPNVDEAPSRRLGLFVVAQYARGLALRVELSGERGVGTVATLSLDHELVVEVDPVDAIEETESSLEAIDMLDPVLQLAVGAELAEHEEDELATASLPTDEEVAEAMATFPSVEIVDPAPIMIEPIGDSAFPSIADIPAPTPEPLPSRIPQATFESVWGTEELEAMPAPEVSAIDPVDFDDDAAQDRAIGAASSVAAFSAGVERGMLDAEAELTENPNPTADDQ